MLNISKKPIQFDFQARTDLATTANGTTINATIFSAFVAKDQTGSKLQIEMSRDKTSKKTFYCTLWKKFHFFHVQIIFLEDITILQVICKVICLYFLKGMLVRLNERDLTREFENTSYVYLTQNLSVRWENKTLSASFLQTCKYFNTFLLYINVEKRINTRIKNI